MCTEWLKLSLIMLALVVIFGIVGGLEKDGELPNDKIQLAGRF